MSLNMKPKPDKFPLLYRTMSRFIRRADGRRRAVLR